jgi:hypothetical protein
MISESETPRAGRASATACKSRFWRTFYVNLDTRRLCTERNFRHSGDPACQVRFQRITGQGS